MALTQAAVGVEASCDLLAAFELCISEVEDAGVQNNLEAELQVKQQTHSNCMGQPMTASIRTERDALDFAGRDFTFHRTTRQSLVNRSH